MWVGLACGRVAWVGKAVDVVLAVRACASGRVRAVNNFAINDIVVVAATLE